MTDYRRHYVPGGAYFFTVAARRRGTWLLVQRAELLKACIRAEQRLAPFAILAAVIMPDHLHMVWRLPQGDSDYPNRWRRIKTRFSRALPGAARTSMWRQAPSQRRTRCSMA